MFRFSSDRVFHLLSLLPKVPKRPPYAWCAGRGVYRRPESGVHEVGGRFPQIQRVVFKLLRISRNSFGPLRSSSFAELPFLVGRGRITQTIDFPACQFRRFRSFVSSGPSPLSTRESQLYKLTDGFGSGRFIGLPCRPGVHVFTRFGRKSNGCYRVLARRRRAPPVCVLRV